MSFSVEAKVLDNGDSLFEESLFMHKACAAHDFELYECEFTGALKIRITRHDKVRTLHLMTVLGATPTESLIRPGTAAARMTFGDDHDDVLFGDRYLLLHAVARELIEATPGAENLDEVADVMERPWRDVVAERIGLSSGTVADMTAQWWWEYDEDQEMEA
jgi:hypothetical protein